MIKKLVYLIFGLLILENCATPGSPTGGPRDETPPRLDTAKSTPNMQTNFTKQRLVFVFDEWVKLENVIQQVVVSPPLNNPFKVTLKGKTVRFDFPENEPLKENATYTINFGDAVKDLTESNPAQNFRFVFSTGDKIDSLEISGSIVDAYTGLPLENVLMMLYENLEDSVVMKERPFYFAKTSKEGLFHIQNLRAGTFKAFALQDALLDYLYNNPEEPIGFPDKNITLTDSAGVSVDIRLSTPVPPLAVKKVEEPHFGLARIILNRRPYEAKMEYEDAGQQVIIEKSVDTLKLWYNMEGRKNWRFYLRDTLGKRDTILIKPPAREKLDTLKRSNVTGGGRALTHNHGKPVQLSFNHPLIGIDTSRILVLEDSIMRPVLADVSIDTINRRNLAVRYSWKQKTPYQIALLPGAVTDIFKMSNDTIRQKYSVMDRKELGSINLTINGFDPGIHYVLELLDKSDNLVASFYHHGSNQMKQRLESMAPGVYKMLVVEDVNGNRRWDPADYNTRRQPERLFRRELEELRANWELEVVFDVQF